MKKTIFSKLALASLALVTSFTFSACNHDDETDEPNAPEEPKVEDKFTTEYTFDVEFSEDLLKTMDVKAYVLSPKGSVTEESITEAKNTWMLKGDSVPDKAGVRLAFQLKSDEFSGAYSIGYTANSTVICRNNDIAVSTKSSLNGHTLSIAAEKLPEYYEKRYASGTILAGEVNSSGEASITDGSNLDFGLN